MTSHAALIGAAVVSGYMGLASAWHYVVVVTHHQPVQEQVRP